MPNDNDRRNGNRRTCEGDCRCTCRLRRVGCVSDAPYPCKSVILLRRARLGRWGWRTYGPNPRNLSVWSGPSRWKAPRMPPSWPRGWLRRFLGHCSVFPRAIRTCQLRVNSRFTVLEHRGLFVVILVSVILFLSFYECGRPSCHIGILPSPLFTMTPENLRVRTKLRPTLVSPFSLAAGPPLNKRPADDSDQGPGNRSDQRGHPITFGDAHDNGRSRQSSTLLDEPASHKLRSSSSNSARLPWSRRARSMRQGDCLCSL